MTITVIGANAQKTSTIVSDTTFTVKFDATGWADGDLAVVMVNKEDDAGNFTAPTGWTQQGEWSLNATEDSRAAIFTRQLESGDDDQPTFDTNEAAQRNVCYTVVILRGHNIASPIDDGPDRSDDLNDSTPNSGISMTSTKANCMFLCWHSARNTWTTARVPSPFTYQADADAPTGQLMGNVVGTYLRPTAGSEAYGIFNHSSTNPTDADGMTLGLVIAPAINRRVFVTG